MMLRGGGASQPKPPPARMASSAASHKSCRSVPRNSVSRSADAPILVAPGPVLGARAGAGLGHDRFLPAEGRTPPGRAGGGPDDLAGGAARAAAARHGRDAHH